MFKESVLTNKAWLACVDVSTRLLNIQSVVGEDVEIGNVMIVAAGL
jgi:hypothetical protein